MRSLPPRGCRGGWPWGGSAAVRLPGDVALGQLTRHRRGVTRARVDLRDRVVELVAQDAVDQDRVLLADGADLHRVPDALALALVGARLLGVQVAEAVDRAGLDRVGRRAVEAGAAVQGLVDLDLVAAVDLHPVL